MLEDMTNLYNRKAREAASRAYGLDDAQIREVMEQERYCYGIRDEECLLQRKNTMN